MKYEIFKEISELIKIEQTIEYNIMDWMNYYNHDIMEAIYIKGFNNGGFLILDILFLDKNLEEQKHTLTVGVHKDKLTIYENYNELLNCLFSKFRAYPYKYFERYGLNDVELIKKNMI
jgi:hypothetical protein